MARAHRAWAISEREKTRSVTYSIDCKTVVFFANASDGVGPSSNERSGASVKTARENGERR